MVTCRRMFCFSFKIMKINMKLSKKLSRNKIGKIDEFHLQDYKLRIKIKWFVISDVTVVFRVWEKCLSHFLCKSPPWNYLSSGIVSKISWCLIKSLFSDEEEEKIKWLTPPPLPSPHTQLILRNTIYKILIARVKKETLNSTTATEKKN